MHRAGTVSRQRNLAPSHHAASSEVVCGSVAPKMEVIMKQWQEDLLVFAAGLAFWAVLWLAYLAGQGELL